MYVIAKNEIRSCCDVLYFYMHLLTNPIWLAGSYTISMINVFLLSIIFIIKLINLINLIRKKKSLLEFVLLTKCLFAQKDQKKMYAF